MRLLITFNNYYFVSTTEVGFPEGIQVSNFKFTWKYSSEGKKRRKKKTRFEGQIFANVGIQSKKLYMCI